MGHPVEENGITINEEGSNPPSRGRQETPSTNQGMGNRSMFYRLLFEPNVDHLLQPDVRSLGLDLTPYIPKFLQLSINHT